jgi:cation:H+ antiporter
MNAYLLIWAQFLLCVAVIGVAGVRLIRYGDAIAVLTGLSRSWVGLILVATVTSLPELVFALTASVMSGAVVVALVYRPGSRIWNIGSWASIALLALYLLNALVHYRHGA